MCEGERERERERERPDEEKNYNRKIGNTQKMKERKPLSRDLKCFVLLCLCFIKPVPWFLCFNLV